MALELLCKFCSHCDIKSKQLSAERHAIFTWQLFYKLQLRLIVYNEYLWRLSLKVFKFYTYYLAKVWRDFFDKCVPPFNRLLTLRSAVWSVCMSVCLYVLICMHVCIQQHNTFTSKVYYAITVTPRASCKHVTVHWVENYCYQTLGQLCSHLAGMSLGQSNPWQARYARTWPVVQVNRPLHST